MRGELDWSGYTDLRSGAPGTVVAVVEDDEPVASHSCGVEEPGVEVPLGLDSVLYAASIAKQFTGACVADLILHQELSLDTPARAVLATLEPSLDPVTVGHLVTHTSGLPDSNLLDERVGFAAESRLSNADRLVALAGVQLEAAPGSVRRYNNLGYVLLAEIVATITGLRFGEYAKQALLKPAGMHASGFLDTDHPALVPGWHAGQRVDLGFTSVGDGGLVTTVRDLMAWNRWLPTSPVAELVLGDRPTLPDGALAHDAWGVSIRPHHGVRIESHGGAMTGYLASFVRFPHQRYAFITMTNTDDLGPVEFSRRLRVLADSALGDILDHRQPAWTDTHGLPADGVIEQSS